MRPVPTFQLTSSIASIAIGSTPVTHSTTAIHASHENGDPARVGEGRTEHAHAEADHEQRDQHRHRELEHRGLHGRVQHQLRGERERECQHREQHAVEDALAEPDRTRRRAVAADQPHDAPGQHQAAAEHGQLDEGARLGQRAQ
jgi:hypothetical protein